MSTRIWLAVLLGVLVSAHRARADAPASRSIQITRSGQDHGAEPAIASGTAGWAVAWEEQKPKGPDRKRRIYFAVLDRAGALRAGPTLAMESGSMPSEIRLVAKGGGWALVVCNPHWGSASALSWGEISARGAFQLGGRKELPRMESLRCEQPVVEGERIHLYAANRAEEYGLEGEAEVLKGVTCSTQSVLLDKRTATVEKGPGLCRVLAWSSKKVLGIDERERLVVSSGRGRPQILLRNAADQAVSVPDGYAAIGGQKLHLLEPTFRPRGAPIAIKAIIVHVTALLAVGGDAFAVLTSARKEMLPLIVFGRDGKTRTERPLPLRCQQGETNNYVVCSGSDSQVGCVYTSTAKGSSGEVYAVFGSLR